MSQGKVRRKRLLRFIIVIGSLATLSIMLLVYIPVAEENAKIATQIAKNAPQEGTQNAKNATLFAGMTLTSNVVESTAKKQSDDLTDAASNACPLSKGTAAAAPYSSSKPNQVVVNGLSESEEAMYIDYGWKAASVSEAQVAVCFTSSSSSYTCPYNGGYQLTLNFTELQISLVNLRTAAVIAKQTFSGGIFCPYSYNFTQGVYHATIDGDPPDAAKIMEWVKKALHQ